MCIRDSNKIRIISNPDPASVVFEFSLCKHILQDICILILRGNVMQQHNAPLNTISEMVELDVNMLGPVMEYRIN